MQIKIPSHPVESAVVLVCKRVRQGSVVSPSFYNDSVLPAQARVAMSCVSNGIDVSLVMYVDDLVDLNRSTYRLSKNLYVLNMENNNVGLSLNVSKSAVLFFNAEHCE